MTVLQALKHALACERCVITPESGEFASIIAPFHALAGIELLDTDPDPGARAYPPWQTFRGGRAVRRGVGQRRQLWNSARSSLRCSRSCGINPAPRSRSL